MQVVDFLNIEPQLNFNSASGHFEDLPENFLETISPQQNSGNNGGGSSAGGNGGSQEIDLGQLHHHQHSHPGNSGNGSTGSIVRTSNINTSHLVSLAPMIVTSGSNDG